MAKLKAILEKIYTTGDLPRNITPYMADVLVDIYNALVSGKRPTFVEQGIRDLLVSCGITVEQNEVGYIAYA